MEPRDLSGQLRRDLGLRGAVLAGLGSILGTGLFIGVGLAAGVASSLILPAIALAALLALANALSSAQLAAAYPVSGGTYEYGHRLLHPLAGFAAGWLFLVAKSASAAAAALAASGYVLTALDVGSFTIRISLAVALVAILMLITLAGVRRTTAVNALLVGVTITALLALVLVALPETFRLAPQHGAILMPASSHQTIDLLHATALIFVAYTGYGRIATLGEEVADPARTIPRAILITLTLCALLYACVGGTALAILGADDYASITRATAAPLEEVAHRVGGEPMVWVIALAALTAMLGVLLNLILGLSRVLLAMARRGDAPAALAKINEHGTTPGPAVAAVGVIIAGITLTGGLALAWSVSAVAVLIYYALTHLAALRMPASQRLYPRWIAVAGLIGCLSLTPWIDPRAWILAIIALALGLLLRSILHATQNSRP